MNATEDVKACFLAAQKALHPHPERIRDAAFQEGGFFDPRDLVQVRYEMLRRHLVEGKSVAEVTRDFGMSRQMFYVLLGMFQKEGLSGLLPRKRGPKGAHKCTDAIIAFVASRRQEDPDRSLQELVVDVKDKFGVQIHPRTLQRQLLRQEKKRHRKTPESSQ
jgi:transposase